MRTMRMLRIDEMRQAPRDDTLMVIHDGAPLRCAARRAASTLRVIISREARAVCSVICAA